MVGVVQSYLGIGLWLLLLIPLASRGAAQHQKTESPAQIVADLTSDNRASRIAGYSAFLRVPLQDRVPEMNAALHESLVKELAMGRAIATGKIPPIPWDAGHDFVAGLMESVQELRDPAHIPLFVQLTHTGTGVQYWLVSFGRLALPALIARIDGVQPALERDITGVLTTLRFLIEAWGLDYFTDEERAEFRRLAVQFVDLKPGEYLTDAEIWDWQEADQVFRPARLAGAMQLACALNEPGLCERMIAIGSDPEALRLRGVTDADAVRRFNREFEPLAAGEPLLIRYAPR